MAFSGFINDWGIRSTDTPNHILQWLSSEYQTAWLRNTCAIFTALVGLTVSVYVNWHDNSARLVFWLYYRGRTPNQKCPQFSEFSWKSEEIFCFHHHYVKNEGNLQTVRRKFYVLGVSAKIKILRESHRRFGTFSETTLISKFVSDNIFLCSNKG